MKIKDLSPQTILTGIKVKTPSGRVGYWASQWQKGVWLSKTKNIGKGKVEPVFVKNIKEVLEWEVLADNE